MRRGKCVYCGGDVHYGINFVCDKSAGHALPYSISDEWEPPETKDEQIKALKRDTWHQKQRENELLIKISGLEVDIRRLKSKIDGTWRKSKIKR